MDIETRIHERYARAAYHTWLLHTPDTEQVYWEDMSEEQRRKWYHVAASVIAEDAWLKSHPFLAKQP